MTGSQLYYTQGGTWLGILSAQSQTRCSSRSPHRHRSSWRRDGSGPGRRPWAPLSRADKFPFVAKVWHIKPGLREELPGPVDRFLFEVIAEAPWLSCLMRFWRLEQTFNLIESCTGPKKSAVK